MRLGLNVGDAFVATINAPLVILYFSPLFRTTCPLQSNIWRVKPRGEENTTIILLPIKLFGVVPFLTFPFNHAFNV